MHTLFQSCNPSTEEILKTFKGLTNDEMEQRLQKAQAAQKQWRKLALKDRVKMIKRVGELLEQNAETFGQLMHIEMGKLIHEGVAEAKKCASLCSYSTSQAEKILTDQVEEISGASVAVHHEALGIILAVMPWNFPFWQLFRAAVPTLLAGNTILLKHAMNTPQCALAIEELFRKAVPDILVVQNLFIDHEQASVLISDKRVKGVTLTGSKAAGVAVATAAAQAVKPCTLELGGSDPFIVFSDANLEDAVKIAVTSRCMNNGQSCIAAKRFLIERPLFDRFANMMTEQMSLTNIGPQATKRQQQILKDQVDDAVSKGARVHCGGTITSSKGFFYPPTVLSQIKASMRVAHEEVFGPVALLFAFDSDDDALQMANESDFGLGAAVFTQNKNRAQRFADELECGQVFINDMVRSNPRFPFGGIKESGVGRELGPHASLAFTNEKTIWTSRPQSD